MLKTILDTKPEHIIKAEELAKKIYNEELACNYVTIVETIKKTLLSLNNNNIENIRKA